MSIHTVILTGLAGPVAGAFSKGTAEYVSVINQNELVHSEVAHDADMLAGLPAAEQSFVGRRDAFLMMISEHLGYPNQAARDLATVDFLLSVIGAHQPRPPPGHDPPQSPAMPLCWPPACGRPSLGVRITGKGEQAMAVTTQTMTNEQRKSVALEYLKAFDNGGTTSSGGSILDLFAQDAQVMFPKWGLAEGHEAIGRMFADVGGTLKSIKHHYAEFTWIFSGGDLVVAEGTSHGEHIDGPWRAGVPDWAAGRWCDVFEIRDWLIQRCFIYLDPDYAGKDTVRYPWLQTDRD